MCRRRCGPTTRQPRPPTRVPDHALDHARRERAGRSPDLQEQRAAPGLRSAAKIGHQRLADIDRQRQAVKPRALAVHDDLAAPPIDIVERQRGDFAGAQSKPHHQQQDRVVAPADRASPVTTGQQLSDRDRVKAAWKRAIAQIRDPRHRPPKRSLDQPGHVQVAQQRTQALGQLARPGDAALRALAREELRHVGRGQPLQVQAAALRALAKEQPRDTLIPLDRLLP